MSQIFANSAIFYDAIYKKKDYRKEADYVVKSVKSLHPKAKNLLEMGCGTGNYSFVFRDLGFNVLGVDASEAMIKLANQKKSSFKARNISFQQSNAEDFQSTRNWDLVISLFFMLGYQVSDSSLMKTFHSIRSCLKKGDIFAFDFWHGPSVLKEGTKSNKIHVETGDHLITRNSSPTTIPENNCLKIEQSFSIQKKKTGEYESFTEIHFVRYFFENELTSFLNKSGFDVIKYEAFMGEKTLDDTEWAGMAFARAL
jgi:SAM-dependent methyltransferase